MTTTQTKPVAHNGKSRPSASRQIPVRRLEVDLREAEFDRWIVPNDPIFSHLLAVLSAVFPPGEDFFVASVRMNKDAIGDNERLQAQVKAFIGQEAMHSREHQRINGVLDGLGHRTARAEKNLRSLCNNLLKLRPKTLPLAMTAAAEHLTGLFAEVALGSEMTRQTLFSHPDIESLITWHALEELEHKNVAFDVLGETNSGYVIRIGGFVFTLVFLAGFVIIELGRNLWEDRDEIGREELATFRHNFPRQTLISGWFVRQTLRYLRPGFHPDDIETDHMIEEWREKLSAKTTITAGMGAAKSKNAAARAAAAKAAAAKRSGGSKAGPVNGSKKSAD